MSLSGALVAISVGSSMLRSMEDARALRGSAFSLEEQAAQALALGRRRAERIRERGERAGGEIRALAAAAGLELSGSPLAVEINNVMQVEKAAGEVIWQAEVYAKSLRTEAGRRRSAAGRIGRSMGLVGASSFLSSGSRAGFFDENGGDGDGGGQSQFEPYGE